MCKAKVAWVTTGMQARAAAAGKRPILGTLPTSRKASRKPVCTCEGPVCVYCVLCYTHAIGMCQVHICSVHLCMLQSAVFALVCSLHTHMCYPFVLIFWNAPCRLTVCCACMCGVDSMDSVFCVHACVLPCACCECMCVACGCICVLE